MPKKTDKTKYSIMLIEDPKKYYYNYFVIESEDRESYIRNWYQRCNEFIGMELVKWGEGMSDYDFFMEFPNGCLFSPTAIFTTISKDVYFHNEEEKDKKIKYLVLKHNLLNSGNWIFYVPRNNRMGEYVFGKNTYDKEYRLYRKIASKKEQEWVLKYENFNGEEFKNHFDNLITSQK